MTQASGLIEPYSESDLTDPILGPWTRGFPSGRGPMRRSQVGAQGWNVLAGDLPLPLAVVREAPLRNNLQWMQQFARSHGVGLAPHGKTSLSPQLFRRQIEAGAWGITVANAAQLQVAVASGVRRCLIANQVLTPPDLLAIAELLQASPGLRVLFLLDSVAQLLLIEQAAATWSGPVSATVFERADRTRHCWRPHRVSHRGRSAGIGAGCSSISGCASDGCGMLRRAGCTR